MIDPPPTVVLRHRRENLKKCSLSGLEKRPDFAFYTYPRDSLPDLSGYILLKVGAPPLTEGDAHRGLFVIDGTWHLAEKMEKSLAQRLEARSLPGNFRTAYPRRQTGCSDPEAGLSSLEAIYLAYRILRRPAEELLDSYHWKDSFLLANDLIYREDSKIIRE